MLPQLRVASPCTADWEKMPGGDQVRYCEQCKLSVYNFSALTSPEVEQLLARHTGRLCGRLYRRADGTILTKDCPVGLRFLVRRVSRVAGAALTALMSVGFATAQEATRNPPVVQIQNVNAGVRRVYGRRPKGHRFDERIDCASTKEERGSDHRNYRCLWEFSAVRPVPREIQSCHPSARLCRHNAESEVTKRQNGTLSYQNELSGDCCG